MNEINFIRVNGWEAIHVKNGSPIANARIIVNAGSWRELDPADHGAAHFLEHMLFKGTSTRSYKELNSASSRMGDINAYTTLDRTVFNFSFLVGDLADALKLLTEIVWDSQIPDAELQNEIGVIVQEYSAAKSNPHQYFWYTAFAKIIAGHWTLGDESSIKGMTRDRLLGFLKRNYVPGNVRLAVVGGVDVSEVIHALSHCPCLPEIDADCDPMQQPNYPFIADDANLTHPSEQATVGLFFPGVSTQEEFQLNYVPDVLANIIGGGMHSMMFDRLREELGLCYACAAWHQSYPDSGIFGTSINLAEEHIERAVAETKTIIKRCCNGDIPLDLMETAKRNVAFSVARSLETSRGIAGHLDCAFSVSKSALNALVDSEASIRMIQGITIDDVATFAEARLGRNEEWSTQVTMTPAKD